MNPHIPEWTPTLGVKIPMDFWTFREQFERSKLIGLRNSLYHWKALKIYMSKIWSYYPFEYLQHKLCSKERIALNLCACRCVIYFWKTLEKTYNFSLNLASIGGLHKKLWASKVAKVLISKISGLPTWESWEKWHLGVVLMAKHRKYYKWKSGGFSKSKSWWILWVRVCSWLVHAPKVLQLCINKIVIWFVQINMNNWLAYHSS
jgi:hypothetical protein